MPNQSEVEDFMVLSAYLDGTKIGQKIAEKLAEAARSGHISVNESIVVNVGIDDLIQYDFSLRDKILANMGSPLVMASGNTGLAVGGGAIFLTSGTNFFQTNNKLAKMFYLLSIVCSGTGAVSSTISVYCEKCGLCKTGMLGDGFGGLFLYAGNKANTAGQALEGKMSWGNFFSPRGQVKRPVPKFGSGYRGLTFVGSSGSIENIPYLELISAGLAIYSTYRCAKLVFRCSKSIYKYVDKKLTPQYNLRHVVLFVSEYLVESFSIKQTYRIYHAAITLHYR